MEKMRHCVKDSVFTKLFGQSRYARELYLALHPEDVSVTEEDCKLVTLENILTTGIFNDVGIQVRQSLIFLVEAQSLFSYNIPLRLLLYIAETYKEYIEENKLDIYREKAVPLPRPELYVVYTGQGQDIPDVLRLSSQYVGTGDVEVLVKVLRSRGTGDIVDQYVRFCKVEEEQRQLHGQTLKAAEETIEICIGENVLAEFLSSRRKEVTDIMVTLFDQEKVTRIWEYNLVQDAQLRGQAEGIEKGMEEGMEKGIRAAVAMLKSLSIAPGIAQQNLAQQFGLSMDAAKEKLDQYWQ